MSIPPDDGQAALEFGLLLEYLKHNRGFDFSGYKRPGLQRRVGKRMQTVQMESYSDYMDYLEVHPEEFAQLFNTILINVTTFFRDPLAWEFLATDIIPRLLAEKKPQEPLRVWSAGCASGEEAYTLAIVLAEAMGLEAFRQRVKIYATDVDKEALAQARHASYPDRALQSISAELQSRYFEPSGTGIAFRFDLRRSVIFGRHDLMQDAPISHLDLLLCRNTLMYFNAEMQSRILSRFHFALNNTGVIFLGKAEMLLSQTSLFTPRHLKHRIFSKVPMLTLRDRLLVVAQAGTNEIGDRMIDHIQLREAAFDAIPLAQVVVDMEGIMTLTSQDARTAFGLLPQHVGRPFYELDLSYRPVELRACLQQVYAEQRPQRLVNIERVLSSGQLQYFDVHLLPLRDSDGTLLGVSITFYDVTAHRRLQVELEKHRQELETAYEELQSTNEELETTNEELQSTNEELETMNEELQSGNEELQTTNDELRERTDELNRTKGFLEAIFSNIHTAAIVIDANFIVTMWNAEATRLWGLRSAEVQGQSFLNLDIGLPIEQLQAPVRAVLNDRAALQEVVLEAINRRGKAIRCRITCTPLLGTGRNTQGVILLMEEWSNNV